MAELTGQRQAASLRAHLIKGAAGSFVLQVGFAGLSFLNAIILARVLGAEGYGAFANAMAWVSLLTIPATFGFGILLVRDVAIYRAQQKWGLLKGLLRFSDRFVLVLAMLLALVAAGVAAWMFPSPAQAIMRHTIWIALLLLPLFALYNLREAATRGLEFVIRARLPGMIIRPGLLLAGIAVIYLFWPQHLSAPVAMAVNVLAGVVALGLGIFWLKRLLPPEIKKVRTEYERRAWLKAAFPMLVYGGAQIVLGQTDIVMLGGMRSAEEVGLYAASNRLAFLLVYVMMASNMIIAPIMSRLYTEGEKDRLQNIITRAVRLSFFSVLPLGLIFVFMGADILKIFGSHFVSARPALLILSIGRLIDVFIGVGTGALMLTMAGKEKTVAYVFLFSALVNIVLNAFLIPLYGIMGAAIATMLSLLSAKMWIAEKVFLATGIYVTVLGCFLHPLTEKGPTVR